MAQSPLQAPDTTHTAATRPLRTHAHTPSIAHVQPPWHSTDMQYTAIVVESKDEVDTLTLNRPSKLNSFNKAMVDELLHYFGGLCDGYNKVPQPANTPRVVVLKANGRAFCAGLDLTENWSEGAGFTVDSVAKTQRRISDIILRMRRCPQPIVCCVQGAACGGGLALACAADVRLATENVKFNVAMIKIGLTGCDLGISYLLPRLAGPSVAAELMMTGRFMRAQRALSSGFVSSLHPTTDSMAEACESLVDDMLSTSRVGLIYTKSGFNASLAAPSLQSQVELEDRQQTLLVFESSLAAMGVDLADPDFASKGLKSKL